MKKSMMKNALVGVACLLTGAAWAQTPDLAYWVTESSVRPHRLTIVRYYDAHHQLMRADTLPGRCLNVRHRRVARALNRSLRMVSEQWALRPALGVEQPSGR